MAIAELTYALGRVLEAPWADKLRIFAGGFDEGGDACWPSADPALAAASRSERLAAPAAARRTNCPRW